MAEQKNVRQTQTNRLSVPGIYLCAWSWFSKVIWTVCVLGSLLVPASQCSTLPYGFSNGSISSNLACCGIPLMTILAVVLQEEKDTEITRQNNATRSIGRTVTNTNGKALSSAACSSDSQLRHWGPYSRYGDLYRGKLWRNKNRRASGHQNRKQTLNTHDDHTNNARSLTNDECATRL